MIFGLLFFVLGSLFSMVSCDDMLDTEPYVDTFDVEIGDKWGKIHLTDSVFYVGPQETLLETTVLDLDSTLLSYLSLDFYFDGTRYGLSLHNRSSTTAGADCSFESPYLDAAIEGQKITMTVKENKSGQKLDLYLHLQTGPNYGNIEIHQSAK